jgi:PAS domain S-box-containing protein
MDDRDHGDVEARDPVDGDAGAAWRSPWRVAVAMAAAGVAATVLFPGATRTLVSPGEFLPHGHCYLWRPGLVWLNVVADLLIGLAYVSISATLAYLVARGRSVIPFSWMFLAFGAFIIACGMTHFMEVWTLWTPRYWLAGTVKAVTAVVSVATAVLLPPLVPTVLALLENARRSEEATRERERVVATNARLAATLESSDDAIIGLALDGTISSWNRGAERMYGYAADAIVGRHCRMLAPDDDGDEIDRRLEAVAGGQPVRYQAVGVRNGGRRLHVSASLSPVLDPDGTVVGASAIHRDITAAKEAAQARLRAQAELEERVVERTAELERANEALWAEMAERTRAEGRFRAAVESAPTAMLTVDAEGLITFANGEAERLFGYAADELRGQAVELLVPERDRARHPGERAAFLRQPSARVMAAGRQVRGRHRDGHEIAIEVGLSAIETARGTFVLVMVLDMTARKRAEEDLRLLTNELLRSNRELEQFAYVASHDLQEPLRMVASYTQLLRKRYAGRLDQDADEFIGFAVDGATRMQALIQDLLVYSRVGRSSVVAKPADAGTALEAALTNLKARLDETSATVTADPLPAVLVDGVQLTQVFQNIIANAVKFRGTGPPHVHVGARLVASGVEFSVRDNGIGFEAKHGERIFQIFQRLHPRSEYPGSGIGLAICKKIVERHGGTITAESVPGEGSTFVFTLPSAAAATIERGSLPPHP